jgi:tetratricopeptide (TPR) repeat protein/TolB-like protein
MDKKAGPRWQLIDAILDKIGGLDQARRTALLDEACEGEPDLRADLDGLLRTYDSARETFTQFPDLQPDASGQPPVRMFSEGEIVGKRFRIVRLIGEGGMGEVYEAEDLELQNGHLALKTVRPALAANDDAVERLMSELQNARRISHPNVCRVHDLFPHETGSGGRLTFFTMELLPGQTLAERLRGGKLTTKEVLPLVKQMAAALDAARLKKVAHGDFKPANVMLVPEVPERVVVTDFGLSKVMPSGSVLLSQTLDGGRWGTPAYMAPEQFLGGRATTATDIYSLGVVCYEMVTGCRPFTADMPLLHALSKLRRRPVPPRERTPELPRRWEAAILRCLDVNPDKRFDNPLELVDELERGDVKKARYAAGAAALAVSSVLLAVPVRDGISGTYEAIARYFDNERTLAVLPFSQENATPEGDALARGMTAAVTDRLATWSVYQKGLHVISADDVMNTGANTPALVHQTLGADAVVTGRMRTEGGRLRVVVALNEQSTNGFQPVTTRTVEIGPGDHELLESQIATQLLRIKLPAMAAATGAPEAEANYLVGRGYLLQGPAGLDAAISNFEQAIEKDAVYAAPRADLGEAYVEKFDATKETGLLKLAQGTLDEAIELDPAAARYRVLRGRVYLATGQYARATLEFQKALSLDASIADARNQLATAYEDDGAIDNAEREYRNAIAVHPKYWRGYQALGIFLYRHGRFREAEENLVIAAAYAPANRLAISGLAAVYEIQQKLPAAEAELLRGLKLSPDALLFNNLGWIYILDQRFDDAVKALEEAVKQPRADSIIWSSLARAYRWSGHHAAEAGAAYQNALDHADSEIRLNPRDPEIRANRAYLLAENHSDREALQELNEALRIENASRNVTVLFRSALVHEWVRDRKSALDALGEAVRNGYPRGRIERDPDLKGLRDDPGYRQVVEMAPLTRK